MTYVPASVTQDSNKVVIRNASGDISAGLISGATGGSAQTRRDENAGIITTTNATAAVIKTITIPANAGAMIGIIVIGRDRATGDVCIFGQSVDIQSTGSVLSRTSTNTRDPRTQGSTTGVTISFSDSGLVLSILVNGLISTTIDWSCWADVLSLAGS